MKIPYGKVTNKTEAYQAVRGVITPELMEKFKVNPEFSYTENESIAAKGKGFSFELKFLETEVEVHLELSGLLKAFKKQVLTGIEKQVNKVISWIIQSEFFRAIPIFL